MASLIRLLKPSFSLAMIKEEEKSRVCPVSGVPEVITHSSCRCSSNVVLFESDPKRSSRLTDVILFAILALNFVDHSAFLFLGCGVLWVYQLLSCGVKRLMVSADFLLIKTPRRNRKLVA